MPAAIYPCKFAASFVQATPSSLVPVAPICRVLKFWCVYVMLSIQLGLVITATAVYTALYAVNSLTFSLITCFRLSCELYTNIQNIKGIEYIQRKYYTYISGNLKAVSCITFSWRVCCGNATINNR